MATPTRYVSFGMTTRTKGILFLIALGGFVGGSLLAGASFLLYKLGFGTGQLALAGVAEMLVSLMFLIAGLAIVPVAVRTFQDAHQASWSRIVFGIVMSFAGMCWISIGIQGIFWSKFVRAALGLG